MQNTLWYGPKYYYQYSLKSSACLFKLIIVLSILLNRNFKTKGHILLVAYKVYCIFEIELVVLRKGLFTANYRT